MNKITALYCRVSSESQFTNGLSLSNQAERLKQYAKLKGYKNTVIFTDVLSGKNTKRKAFIQMLEAVKQGKVEAVLVFSLSRFSRSVSDCISTIQLLNKYNVSFISLTEDINTASATGRFFLTILSALSQMERELIGERTKSVLQFKKSKGLRVGQIGFGKKLGANNRLINNVSEQNTLRLIKHLRNRRRLTFKAIAERLTQLKRKNKANRVLWNSGMVFTYYNKTA